MSSGESRSTSRRNVRVGFFEREQFLAVPQRLPEPVRPVTGWRITENLQRRRKVVCPRVFHRAGQPIKSFRVAFRTACKDAGCPGRVLHDFRRTAVRDLVRAGIHERVAMQMTGQKIEACSSDTIS